MTGVIALAAATVALTLWAWLLNWPLSQMRRQLNDIETRLGTIERALKVRGRRYDRDLDELRDELRRELRR